MKNNPIWWSENRSLCEWKYCGAKRWAPYSWNYCAEHFAEAALLTDKARAENDLPPIAVKWARSRLCGVLNGYTPDLGDVAWDTNYPREHLTEIAQDLGLDLDETKEVQWRAARAAIAARHGKEWGNSRRPVPKLYEGPGSRTALSRSQSISEINSYYDGMGQS